MTRLTNKQLLRSKKLFGDNCQLFFPCDEGSGTVITDVMNGFSVTAAGAEWADAHACKLTVADYDLAANYNLLDLKDKHLLFVHAYKAFTSSAFGIFSLQNLAAPTRTYSISGGAGFAVNDTSGTQTVATVGTPGTGDRILAGTWNPVNGEVKSYEGVDGAAPALVNTEVANAARLAVDSGLYSCSISVNTVGFEQGSYGMAVFAFSDGIPTDILAALAHFSKQWRDGKPEGWKPWITL